MPRVRWSETLEQDESSGTSSMTKDTQRRKSSLKRSSEKRKSVVRKEWQRQLKVDAAETWRERGKLFRDKLIMKDEESGGNAFTLCDNCEIEKYYDVAERVSNHGDGNEMRTDGIVRMHFKFMLTRY